MSWVLRWATALVCLNSLALAESVPGLKVPDGFEVTEFATDEQAHDIFSLTIDSVGRVAVSGPGYVRILEDKDGDGRAETVIPFANGPKSGAQGMFFHGRSLLAMGDGGLLRYRDQNGDGQADGPPDLLLRFKTGGEHDAHSIQQGPDGWWYVMAGNTADISAAYATLPTSPIKYPRAGVLLRFRPDLSGGELIADGFRNTYDFAFNSHGDLFTYDSDDERDISLPWYRPTRVFHTMLGSDHGWVSKSWKRPDHYCDMPPVVASTGRGSPTGAVCYQHTQFPEKYRQGLFILDWTYGRVLHLPLQRQQSTWTATPEDFMTGVGDHGFAPTDIDVGPDGCLYVSVGGRGTRGAVYQIRAAGTPRELPPTPQTAAEQLSACLQAKQPLSSWSRSQWMPLARQLGREPFLDAMLDEQRLPAERVRAIEIVTELFGGMDAATAGKLAESPSVDVRARAAWSVGRTLSQFNSISVMALKPFLNDGDPIVQRCALEGCLALPAELDVVPLMPDLAKLLGSPDRFVRMAASAWVTKVSNPALIAVSKAATKLGPQAVIAYAHGWISRIADDLPKAQQVVIPIAMHVLKEKLPTELKRDAVRLLQRSLGDFGPAPGRAPAFESYASPLPLDRWERELDPLRTELANFDLNADVPILNEEIGRLIAMLEPYNPKLLDAALAGITDDSPAVGDIHRLLVAARIPVQRNAAQRQKIAKALVALEVKFAAQKLPQDSNWNDRIKELYARLAELDQYLAAGIVKEPAFGRPGHVLFLSQLPGDFLPQAIAAFVREIESAPDYPWNNDVIFVLGSSPNPTHLHLVRDQFDRFSVRGAVLMTLAEKALPEDRPKFLAGLESSQHEVLTACLGALEKLPANGSSDEQIALLKALRRLGLDEREYVAREKVVRLLERNTGHSVPFVYGKIGHSSQPEAVAQWTSWVAQRWPEETASQLGGAGEEVAQLKSTLAETPWDAGDVGRGEKLFQLRSCAQCHGGRNALGPDLAGAAGRFSRDDLFTAIVLPSRDVSGRYQTTIIETVQGKTFSGLIVYESVDGLLLRNATNQTFRIETRDIASRSKSPVSLMPNGLLKDLKPVDYADLYAYLRTLGAPPAAIEQTKKEARSASEGQ